MSPYISMTSSSSLLHLNHYIHLHHPVTVKCSVVNYQVCTLTND